MTRAFAGALVALTVLVLARPHPAGAVFAFARAAPTIAQGAQPATANSCADLANEQVVLVREYPSLTPRDGLPAPYPLLCLAYYPGADIYQGTVLGVNGADHFRAVKLEAARQLAEDGIDVCAIGTWNAYGRFTQTDRLLPGDQLDLPWECAPRVLAADPGAARQLRAVQAALERVIALTSEHLGWRPFRALTVIVMTDVDVAVATTLRWTRTLPPEDAAARARDGRSATITGTVYGGLILLNLAAARDPALVLHAALAHEYTHFAQAGIGGSSDYFPYWFIEGQSNYQEERIAGVPFRLPQVAAAMQRDGTAPRLAALSTQDSWFAQEAALGSEAVYARGYMAVAFLVERYGFAATAQLLRENRHGSIARFYALLAQLTSMDLETFDDTLGEWILATVGS